MYAPPAGPSTPTPTPLPSARRSLAAIASAVHVLQAVDDARLAGHAERLRAVRAELGRVLEDVVRRESSVVASSGGGSEESGLEYVEPDVRVGGQARTTTEAANSIVALQREKWILAFEHIRNLHAAQQRDRAELIEAFIAARRARQPARTRARYRAQRA